MHRLRLSIVALITPDLPRKIRVKLRLCWKTEVATASSRQIKFGRPQRVDQAQRAGIRGLERCSLPDPVTVSVRSGRQYNTGRVMGDAPTRSHSTSTRK